MRRRLRTAVIKSHTRPDEDLVRAIACAFFDNEHGLQNCATGFLLPPVSYSVVAWYIRRDTDYVFNDDFDNWYGDEVDVQSEPAKYHTLPHNAGFLPQYTHEEGFDMPMPDLTSLIEGDPDCSRFFRVLCSPNSDVQIPCKSQPYVIADLRALIQGYSLQKVQDILPRIRALTVHPEDPAYAAELNRLTMPSK